MFVPVRLLKMLMTSLNLLLKYDGAVGVEEVEEVEKGVTGVTGVTDVMNVIL